MICNKIDVCKIINFTHPMATTQNNQLSETPVKTEILLSTPAPENGPGIGFFAVGMVVNITLIIAFFIWAYKQGRKREK